jgi:DNA-binding XRE family transcriptional regulator
MKNRNPHPIKRVRAIVEKTQRKMAQILGISRNRYAQIEAGYLPLSRDMANAVLEFSGAIVPEGYGECGEAPRSRWEDEEFSAELYFEWRVAMNDNSKEKTFEYQNMFSIAVADFIKDAGEAGKLEVSTAMLARALIEIRET